MTTRPDLLMRDESDLHWCWLEEEQDACVVVSERMELIYVNSVGRDLVSGEWFGKRCFEAFPVIDETCAFHCPKINAVNESQEVVYCEEIVQHGLQEPATFGVALIPLGANDGRARAVLVMRRKGTNGNDGEFQAKLLRDAEDVSLRIVAREGSIPDPQMHA